MKQTDHENAEMSSAPRSGERRDFLRAGGRALAAALLGALGLHNALRRRSPTLSVPDDLRLCVECGGCRGCRTAHKCALPQALSYRRHLRERTRLAGVEEKGAEHAGSRG